MRHRTIALALVGALAATAAGCDDPLEVNPRASIIEAEAYDEPVELEIAVLGVYDGLQQSDGAYARNTIVYPDLYADVLDFTGTYQTDAQVDQGTVTADNVAIADIWSDYYDVVNRANNVIASAPALADEVGQEQVDEWMAQAQFGRALSYFNLVRFFGGVPLVLEPTWSVEEDLQPARATEAEVYAQIEADLNAAMLALPSSGTSYMPTVGAAEMLLAKAHMEQGDYGAALPLLNDVIGGGYQLMPNYADIFAVEDNPELVFALEFTVNDNNSLAFWFYPDDFGGRLGFAPTSELETSYEGTERFEASIGFDSYGSSFGNKYFRIVNGDDDVPVLRLADAYLMRAEANLREGAAADVVLADINEVRERAGIEPLEPVDYSSVEALIQAIAHERYLELAMEGHRFFDLRRLGLAQDELGLNEYQMLFPIPQRELDVNQNLEQNPGY